MSPTSEEMEIIADNVSTEKKSFGAFLKISLSVAVFSLIGILAFSGGASKSLRSLRIGRSLTGYISQLNNKYLLHLLHEFFVFIIKYAAPVENHCKGLIILISF